jgi:pimeloyl-ACP methyl ester carboxylesterase
MGGRLPPPPLPPFLAEAFPFERYLVEVEGIRIHVAEAGAGLPVVLVHGNPTWGFLWRKVAARLAGAPLRLVMPDLAGFGLSDKPRDLAFHTVERHASIVSDLLDGLGIERAVLALHDWGGPIGLLGAAARPGRVAGLVVTNTLLGPPRAGSKGTWFHRFARRPIVSDLAFRGLGFPQRDLSRAQGDPRSIRGDVARAYRWPLRRIHDRAGPLALARMVPIGAEDHPSVPALRRCLEAARAFRGPVSIVWGERDPILGRALRRVVEVFPEAPVARTRGGHFLQEEVPDEIAAAIRSVAAGARG